MTSHALMDGALLLGRRLVGSRFRSGLTLSSRKRAKAGYRSSVQASVRASACPMSWASGRVSPRETPDAMSRTAVRKPCTRSDRLDATTRTRERLRVQGGAHG